LGGSSVKPSDEGSGAPRSYFVASKARWLEEQNEMLFSVRELGRKSPNVTTSGGDEPRAEYAI
jgi:hypothetical protein